MDDRYPKYTDFSPKRRKLQDNPYSIFSVSDLTNTPHYYISFKDSQNIHVCMEISKQLYDLFDCFELEDLSYMNEMDRHYEQFSTNDEKYWRKHMDKCEPLEDQVIRVLRKERLHQAIQRLSEKQRKRLELYYFGGFTYKEIAEMEGCSVCVVAKSVAAAKKKLKRYLDKKIF